MDNRPPKEYSTLFNTVTDTISALDELLYKLRWAQINAEELYIRAMEENDPGQRSAGAGPLRPTEDLTQDREEQTQEQKGV